MTLKKAVIIMIAGIFSFGLVFSISNAHAQTEATPPGTADSPPSLSLSTQKSTMELYSTMTTGVFNFSQNGRLILKIGGDGGITFGPDVKPSEAALEFAKQLKILWPQHCLPGRAESWQVEPAVAPPANSAPGRGGRATSGPFQFQIAIPKDWGKR